jgi:hypothetical protein
MAASLVMYNLVGECPQERTLVVLVVMEEAGNAFKATQDVLFLLTQPNVLSALRFGA